MYLHVFTLYIFLAMLIRRRKFRLARNCRGAALVAVLAVVAILALLAIAFLSRSGTRHETEVRSSESLSVDVVADDAVDLVIAQLRAATEAEKSGWASQPGVVRTWDEGGNFAGAFKLYSDETMIEGDEHALLTTDFDDLGNGKWEDQPGVYVDINEPYQKDGRHVYPVASPEAKDRYRIEGFHFNHREELVVRGSGNTLPMPVKWIYQLEDSTLGTLNPEGEFVPWSGGSRASVNNRMIARFAFWTDDESCKLNPNVHAGGIALGAPFAGGSFDRAMTGYPAYHNEWQHYDGHPATTSLAPLFFPDEEGLFRTDGKHHEIQQLYEIVPKVASRKANGIFATPEWRGVEKNGIVVDHDPLYPSVDDLLMTSDREIRTFPGIDRADSADFLEKAKFFLTVDSVSPETTFGGLPRVSIWPTSETAGSTDRPHRTAMDDAIRWCAELPSAAPDGAKAFHFQRKNADSPTADFEEIPRNRELFHYLDRQLEETMPGVGKRFSDKYEKAERLQILTGIFDTIRSTNLHDDALFAPDSPWARFPADENRSDHLTYTNGRIDPSGNPGEVNPTWSEVHKGHGQVTPIQISHPGGIVTRGAGRFYTLQETAVQVIACADGGDGTGGGVWRQANPGATPERGNRAARFYSNFPPLPLSVRRNDRTTWPLWMHRLADSQPDLVEVAFDPKHWNWQLAWLDPDYVQAMPEGKFDRRFLKNAEVTRLGEGERLVQAAIIWSLVCPALGNGGIHPDLILDIEVNGMSFRDLNHTRPEFGWKTRPRFSIGEPDATTWHSSRASGSRQDHLLGGFKMPSFFQAAGVTLPGEISLWEDDSDPLWKNGQNVLAAGRVTSLDRHHSGSETYHRYPYVTAPFKVSDTVEMDEGAIGLRIYSPGAGSENEGSASQISRSQLVQEFEIRFPAFSAEAPDLAGGQTAETERFAPFPRLNPMAFWSLGWDGANPETASIGRMALSPGDLPSPIVPDDLVQSVAVRELDSRFLMTRTAQEKDNEWFVPHKFYDSSRMAHSFFRRTPGATFDYDRQQARTFGIRDDRQPELACLLQPSQRYGDFDSGYYLSIPGPWINKPNEGNGHYLQNRDQDFYPPSVSPTGGDWRLQRRVRPYPDSGGHRILPSLYTPNRIVCSPGIFGSLPVGTRSGERWRTLLFRPQVEGKGIPRHPGGGTSSLPADHLLLDLFWMPVVEPWMISEKFSTRGKVNLNHQILPFRHVERNTALRGILESETLLCVPNQWARDHKANFGRGRGYHWRDNPYGGTLQQISLRAAILPDATLDTWWETFENPDQPTLFRTASEICDLPLIPGPPGGEKAAFSKLGSYTPTAKQLADGTYHSDHRLVGDDARERPYANLYSRLTTRSNAYCVHVRAQRIRQTGSPDRTDFAGWDETNDVILSEHRGHRIIERYLDFEQEPVPDFATCPDPDSLERYYRYRIVRSEKFGK